MNNEPVTIEIADGKVETKSGKIKSGQRAGEDYRIRSQKGYMDTGSHYPVEITLTLSDDHAGYAPGIYSLGRESFKVGDFGVPGLARVLVLHQIVKTAVKAA